MYIRLIDEWATKVLREMLKICMKCQGFHTTILNLNHSVETTTAGNVFISLYSNKNREAFQRNITRIKHRMSSIEGARYYAKLNFQRRKGVILNKINLPERYEKQSNTYVESSYLGSDSSSDEFSSNKRNRMSIEKNDHSNKRIKHKFNKARWFSLLIQP